jgi:hypothetical protein
VVKFIIDTYGPKAMSELLAIFAEGALDDEALEMALGVDTDGLDNAFRTSLGLPPLPGTASDASVSAETGSAAAEESNGDAVETVEPLENPVSAEQAKESQESASVEAPAQPPTEPAQPKSSPLGLPCLAGLLPLLVLFALNVRRSNV